MTIMAIGAALIVGLLVGFRLGYRDGASDARHAVIESIERDFGDDA